MRLLIIGINFAPELTGVGKYTGEMAAWLAQKGHDVSVVTTRPYYPAWDRIRGLRSWFWKRETWNGCRVIRCPLYIPAKVSGLQRILHLASFALSSLPATVASLAGRRPDIVLTVAPTLLSAPIALAVARLTGAKAWLHFQDLEIDAAVGLRIVQNQHLAKRALATERRLLKRFDLISAISPKMLAAVQRKGLPPEKLLLLPNWVDTTHIFPLSGARPLRLQLGIADHQLVALYSGSMGKKQGLEYVIEAARQLQSPDSPLFVLAGAGPIRDALEAQAAGLSNVRFMPLQPDEKFNEFLNLADIHLLPQRSDAADLVMPSKLCAMLATGKPVIATAPPDSQIAMTLSGAGIVVSPENATALAAAIQDLGRDSGRRQQLGEAGLRIARTTMDTQKILGAAMTEIADRFGLQAD